MALLLTIVAALALVCGLQSPANTQQRGKTMKLALLVSYDDEAAASGEKEQVLIDRLFGQMKEAGVQAVVWRSVRGGQAMFKSKQYKLFWPPNLAEFDPMAAARQKAQELGLEFIIWHEVKGGEAHGWDLHSTFVKEHPEFLSTNRLNMTSKSELSWAAPEVMQRRVEIFKEILAYNPDGIWLDHVKGGDVSVPIYDAQGYYSMGYDKYMVEAFKAKTGRDPWQIPNNDPEWLAFRASFMTEYMRKIRTIQQKTHPDVKLGSLAASIGYTHSCWYLPLEDINDPNIRKHAVLASPLANLEDHETWTREGLIDVLVAPHNTFSSLEEFKTIIPDAKSHILGPCQFGVEIWVVPSSDPAFITDVAQLAHEYDAAYLVVRESYDIFNKPAVWDAFKQVAERYSE